MYPKYKIEVWHGEHHSVFSVVRYWEVEDEDWDVVFTAHNRHSAESWIAANVGFGDYTGIRTGPLSSM